MFELNCHIMEYVLYSQIRHYFWYETIGLIFYLVILILNVIIIIKSKVSLAHILILHGFDLVICMTSLPLTFMAAILDVKLFRICDSLCKNYNSIVKKIIVK